MNRPDDRSWKTVLPFLAGIVMFTTLGIVNEARGLDLWRNYAISGVMLGSVVTWYIWHIDVRVPAYIQWVIIGALLLHYAGGSMASVDAYSMGAFGMHGVNGAYHQFEWWDNLTHGVGIAAGTMGCAYLLELYQLRRGLGWSATPIAALAFLSGLAAGVAVELYEFLGKTLFQTIDQGGYINTMTDLQFNILGAAVGAALAVTVNRTRFWAIIQARTPSPPQPASHKVPPDMLGIIVFVSLPAAATLFLATRFLFEDISLRQDMALYDPALLLLAQSAMVAITFGPATAMVAREWRRRKGPSVAP